MQQLGASLSQLLHLHRQPIGLAFVTEVPADWVRIDRSTPAGCAYWTIAASGQRFYTLPEDHFGCPIGALTHGLTLPATVQAELQATVTTMLSLNYLRPDEPAALPRVTKPYQAILYAPLDQLPTTPDVVIVIGNAQAIMLLSESARQVGLSQQQLLGRPGCGMIPQVINTQQAVSNLGCVGNRVYTGLSESEFYFAFPGSQLAALVEALAVIERANCELERHHRAKLATATACATATT
jgi:uncharacterized protein (DUF169 family)